MTVTHSTIPGTHTEDTKCSLLLLMKEKKERSYQAEIPRATLPSVRKNGPRFGNAVSITVRPLAAERGGVELAA